MPLKKPKQDIWFSSVPVGHKTQGNTVKRMCADANIKGFKTNHSLRVTTATRLFQAGIDEHLIMKRTAQRSLDGIRLYKRISTEQELTVSSVLNSEPASENYQIACKETKAYTHGQYT